MYLRQLFIKGFRNFKEITVNFDRHCLIIGSNDVGKTNLLQALRILLDKGFSIYDYELKESDFFAYSDCRQIVIRAYFAEITEECITSRISGISDEGDLVLEFQAERQPRKTTYKFLLGPSDKPEDLNEIDGPSYKRFLNLKYIGSRREFWDYINKAKKDLLLKAKETRTDDLIENDELLYQDIENKLFEVDKTIPELSYIKNATKNINEELNKLSIHNSSQKIVFNSSATEAEGLISKLIISSEYNGKKMLIGGEGRINQIYLSLWASQNQPTDISNEVSIICIEEPEAYLHPHQQRELANYLAKKLSGQVILTTHSPFIVGEFSPNEIIRLYQRSDNSTVAASDGCSEIIGRSFSDFGYRMSVIPAEAFFSDCVILVEGPSELIFYNTLAKQIGVDLDRLNISILNVGGVGFIPYIDILNALSINWIVRTDNDITKVPNSDGKYQFSGVNRAINFLYYKKDLKEEDKKEAERLKNTFPIINDKRNITGIYENFEKIKKILENYGIFLARIDLEEDLYKSCINSDLKDFYFPCQEDEEIVKDMKKRKASRMYEFLKENKSCLVKLSFDDLALPLLKAKNYIETNYGTY